MHDTRRMDIPANPQLQLETLFSLNSLGRIISTREPQPSTGPAFILIRGAINCAWAVRADIENGLACKLESLAKQETESTSWEQPLLYTQYYQELLNGKLTWGPCFAFPENLKSGADKSFSIISDEASLETHFSGWIPGEINAGRSPVIAATESGQPVSVCFCARRSTVAAEAGVETAAPFRGRGYAPRVTSAWAESVRQMGLTPLYSTDWTNGSSLAVARKLGLIQCTTRWCIT
jgi:hypothetical protein